MRAVTISEPGGPEVLGWGEVPDPVRGPGEVPIFLFEVQRSPTIAPEKPAKMSTEHYRLSAGLRCGWNSAGNQHHGGAGAGTIRTGCNGKCMPPIDNVLGALETCVDPSTP